MPPARPVADPLAAMAHPPGYAPGQTALSPVTSLRCSGHEHPATAFEPGITFECSERLLHRGPGIVLLCCRQTARHLAERPERLLPEPEAFRASALSPDSLSPLQPAQGDEALFMPGRRPGSATGTTCLASSRTARIWISVYLIVFMLNSFIHPDK